jgi:alkylation response protein AidB-like acyl-CoA dehydrogenase
MTALLSLCVPSPLPGPRTTSALGAELRRLVGSGALDLPLPGGGRTPRRWAALAALGRCDLVLGRLAEGHVDATAILAEAGLKPERGALYGVWAARSGGTGARIVRTTDGVRLAGTVRYCSGANLLDRALVAATPPEDEAGPGWLVDVDLTDARLHRDQDSWQAIGMDASDSIDVRFAEVPISPDRVIGKPGWYVSRRGFHLGGAGVAAVWLGGAAGVLDSVLTILRDAPAVDEHQLAHLGALHAGLSGADALLAATARELDLDPLLDPTVPGATAKSTVERVARDVLDTVPRITGPTPLCRDREFAQRLADLQVYVRQHHGEKALAALGRAVLWTGP